MKKLLILLVLLILVSGCVEKKVIIKQPDKPNVLKYASQEEIEKVRYKIAPSVLEYGIRPHAVKENDTIEIIVTFYGNVSIDKAREIIAKYGTIFEGSYFLNHYTVRIPSSLFWSLANEKEVRWISEGNPPPQDLD